MISLVMLKHGSGPPKNGLSFETGGLAQELQMVVAELRRISSWHLSVKSSFTASRSFLIGRYKAIVLGVSSTV